MYLQISKYNIQVYIYIIKFYTDIDHLKIIYNTHSIYKLFMIYSQYIYDVNIKKPLIVQRIFNIISLYIKLKICYINYVI